MVFENRLAELLQDQAKKFLHGFSSEQLHLGLLSGQIELRNLALNPAPLDDLLLSTEMPFVVKAGTLSSAVLQISLMQGELELIVEGISLVLAPACRWLSRQEVYEHRKNEIERLEFVHLRSQSQRRALEREMFRRLFADYLSRLKVTVRNVHIRVEMEGEMIGSGYGWSTSSPPVAFGLLLGNCSLVPTRSAAEMASTPPAKDPAAQELLLAQKVDVSGLALYHEPAGSARLHLDWALYQATRSRPLGVFAELPREEFASLMEASGLQHLSAPDRKQLMPPTSLSVEVELKSQSVNTDYHVENCLTMEVVLQLAGPSRLRFTSCIADGVRWVVRRAHDFQMWQYLHSEHGKACNATGRWLIIRSFIALKRRIQSNKYSIHDAITMRSRCKEYIRRYKRKFNGPDSTVAWRCSLPPLSAEDSTRLRLIELAYPADKIVNFRIMAHAEMKTEASLNSFERSDEGAGPRPSPRQRISTQAPRELTPLEQLQLHGQHGYGVNIYRGLPPPPSNLKIHIELNAPLGLWWVCELNSSSGKPQVGGSGAKTGAVSNWAVALDCAKLPLRLLLVDSVADTSVFATLEVPKASVGERPLALLLGRSEAAFQSGSPGRGGSSGPASSGGSGVEEWCSVLELGGAVHCCAQVKTVPMTVAVSPWDIFVHLSCGQQIDSRALEASKGFGRSIVTPSPGSRDSTACIRMRLPLRFASGQEGPFADFLQWCLAPPPSGEPPANSPVAPRPCERSGLAWLAKIVGETCEVAALRAHVVLPPLLLEGVGGSDDAPVQLPRFDAGVHLEHGGLVDGFVVGLHNLRHFAVMLGSIRPRLPKETPRAGASSQPLPRAAYSTPPVPLQALEQAPPLSLAAGALLTALAVVLAGWRKMPAGSAKRVPETGGHGSQGTALLSFMQQRGLALAATGAPSGSGEDEPFAAISLALVLLAIAAGRRAIWDEQDLARALDDSQTSSTVSEVYEFFAAALEVVLTMGFPLHRCCLPLAAWSGSVELLRAAAEGASHRGGPAASRKEAVLLSSEAQRDLVTWAARGAYANPLPRQSKVLRWLVQQKARLDQPDQAGRTVLDWACWAGSEELVESLLRRSDAPLLSPPGGDSSLQETVQPLIMAVAGRSQKVVAMLLRAAGDPHASPPGSTDSSTNGYACGPLLLAVRCCEYSLACEVLMNSAFIAVDLALGSLSDSGPPTKDRCPGGGIGGAAGATRATVVLVESFRRFSQGLSRRNVAEVAASALRAHVPGPHPDEGLFASSQLPLGDVLHPLVPHLPLPVHKVPTLLRPGHPPLEWLRRSGQDDPWGPARVMVEWCVRRGFRADEAFLSKVMSALPIEAQALSKQLMRRSSPPGPLDQHQLPTLLSDITPEIREFSAPEKASQVGWWGAIGNSSSGEAFGGDGHGKRHSQGHANGSGDLQAEAFGKAEAAKDVAGLWEAAFAGRDAALVAIAPSTSKGEVGAWDTARLRADIGRRAEVSSVPAIRIVVLGAPRVGKSTVAQSLAKMLGAEGQLEDGPAWLQIARGFWPSSSKSRAEAHVWDASSASLPGLTSQMLADPQAATVVVAVVDAASPCHRDAMAFLAECDAAIDLPSASFAAPRRVLIVENVFPDPAAGEEEDGTGLEDQGRHEVKGRDHSVRCNPLTEEGCDMLCREFGGLLAEVVGEIEGRSSGTRVGAPKPVYDLRTSGDFREVLTRHTGSPLEVGRVRKPLGERALASTLRGNSGLIEPRAASWAWAAVWASRSTLEASEPSWKQSEVSALSGRSPSSSSRPPRSALVWWDRLEQILGTAGGGGGVPGEGDSKASAALLGSLVDLGLVCPIPDHGVLGRDTMACTKALVPDFARRRRLSPADADLLQGASQGSNNNRAFARLLWAQKSGDRIAAPQKPRLSLRSTLRDFLAQGSLGLSGSPDSRCLRLRAFDLLEVGPRGRASPRKAELEPGFILAFDLVDRAEFLKAESNASAEEVEQPARGHSKTVPQKQRQAAGLEDLAALAAGVPGLTFVVVGTSGVVQPGDGDDFWDVLCSGPHAQWAWHALLGYGGAAQTVFADFRRLDSSQRPLDDVDLSWRLRRPPCVLSASPLSATSSGQPERDADAQRPEGGEPASAVAWLLSGPASGGAAAALLPAAQDAAGGGGLAAFCAALCGRSSSLPGIDAFRFTGGLACCAEFEACLLARSWGQAPALLDEALAAGAEAWALCAAALARLSRDIAGAVAGTHGSALPMLQHGGTSTAGISLVPEGPRPLFIGAGAALSQAVASKALLVSSAGLGLQAWLRICRPSAIWAAAVSARGSLPTTKVRGSRGEGSEVVEALRSALATALSEEMVLEVWRALERAPCFRRAGGSWLQVELADGLVL